MSDTTVIKALRELERIGLGAVDVTERIFQLKGLNPPILVWSFYDAPAELRDISTHGGDEDWLALVPASYYARGHDTPSWLEHGTFGVCDISEDVLENGDRVFIGAHA
jgi:hypothetical protein